MTEPTIIVDAHEPPKEAEPKACAESTCSKKTTPSKGEHATVAVGRINGG